MSADLRLGDCIKGMAALPDCSVDHVICDPPYEAEAHTLQRRVKRATGIHDGGAWGGKGVAAVEALSFAPIAADDRVAFAQEASRCVQRWVVVFCQAEAVAAWRDALEAAGLVYRRACVWVKPDAQPQLSGDRPGMGYESIVCAHRAGRSRWNGGGKVGVYVFNKNEAEPHQHPTQKPIALMEQLVRDFTDPCETVLDPFAGSGTTLVACKRLGRNAIGWEKDPKFHAAAVKRIEAAREQFQLPRLERKPKQSALALPDDAEGAA